MPCRQFFCLPAITAEFIVPGRKHLSPEVAHSLIGLFCGVFGNGPAYTQLTHGIFGDIFRDPGTRFEDAVARTAWPIELHDRADGYVWEMFGPDHVHYVPRRAMTPPGADNLAGTASVHDVGLARLRQRLAANLSEPR